MKLDFRGFRHRLGGASAFLVLAITSPLTPLVAQGTAGLEGRIIGEGGRPLAGAHVRVDTPSLTPVSSLSDGEGYFRLQGLPAGSLEVRVSLIGFQERSTRVVLRAGEVARSEITLEVSPLALEGILVEGQVGQAEALNRQRTAPSIRTIVSSEQIERFPDATVPDALRRIPGVSARPDRGETGFIFIRGLSPDLTTVTMDGARIPSTSQEGRGVELSSIPAEMLEGVEVVKAITPDMHADAVGGSINLQARRPNASQLDGRIEGGSHSLSGGSTYRGGLNYAGVSGPISYVAGADFASQTRMTQNTQHTWGSWEGQQVLNRFLLQQYPIDRFRYSVNGGLNFELDDRSVLFVRGFYSRYDTEEERHRLRYRLDSGTRTSPTSATNFRTEREARRYKWEREIWDLTVGGDHTFAGGIGLDYHASIATGRRTEPYRNYYFFRQTGVDGTLDPSGDRMFPTFSVSNGTNVNELSDFRMTGYEWRLDANRDDDVGLGANLEVPFDLGAGSSGVVKLGFGLNRRDKERDTSEGELDLLPGNAFTMDALGTSSFGRRITPRKYPMGPLLDWDRGVAFYEANRNAFAGDEGDMLEAAHTEDYVAHEQVAAIFAMSTLELGALQVVAGARFEHTSLDYEGKRLVFDGNGGLQELVPSAASSSYGSFFPALHLRYRVDPATNVRLAATRTIARPNFLDLAPNEYIRQDDEEVRRGNPDLRPAHSTNLDLLFERYLSSVGMVQGGLFYKRISDFAYTSRTTLPSGPQAGFDLLMPRNGAEATVYGAEIAWQQRLAFLPGALNGLGVYVNYTYTLSETDFGVSGGRRSKLPEQFEHVWNLAMSYDLGGFSGLLSANYQSDFIDSVRGSPEEDRYGRHRLQLDANLSQQITPNVRAFVQLNNLTNEPYIRYDGSLATPYENEFEGFWGSMGLRFSLR
jgi:TonB-dependent receptor